MNSQPVALNVAVAGFIASAVALAAIFWPDRLSPEAQGAIIAVANSAIVVITIIVTKSQVTPISHPRLEMGTEAEVLRNGQPTGDTVIMQPTPPGPTGVDAGAPGEGFQG